MLRQPANNYASPLDHSFLYITYNVAIIYKTNLMSTGKLYNFRCPPRR